MELAEFVNLTNIDIVQHVRGSGPKVCVCPINGTRRWFTLEHADTNYENIESGYLDTVAKGYVDLFKLFFDHGIETLLVPSFGLDLLERGEEYMQIAAEGFNRLATHPLFLEFYEDYQIQARFYGDYQKHFQDTPYAYLIDQFDLITNKTGKNKKGTLFFGLFAHDASERVAQIGIQFYQEHNRAPSRKEIIEAYYGIHVDDVDIFIGFDKFSAFDMPLVAVGSEDLYFTVSPTLYLTQTQLRTILYDHIYSRKDVDEQYSEMDADDWVRMRKFYDVHQGKTLGVGTKVGDIWYPLPQVSPVRNNGKQ